MLKKLINIILLTFLAVVMCSCVGSRYSTRKGNYLKFSNTLPSIVVPPGAMGVSQKPYYVVPNVAVHAGNAKPSMKPPGLG